MKKSIVAKNKHLESEVEEKLRLKIMELQTNIVDKEKREAVLNDLDKWMDLESDYYDSEIINVIDSQENNNKLVEIDVYIFEVDENLNIISVLDSNKMSITETTYQINSIDGDVMQVTIKIKNDLGIEKVITADGKEIIPQGNKKQIGIDYKVVSGNNYIFKVKASDSEEIKEYVLKADINAKPEINQDESYSYPILTEYRVEINKTVEIDYGENTNNYYSVDDGKTWNEYTGTIKIQKECTIKAKSIIEGEITKETKKEITIKIENGAIGKNAYDYDDETGERLSTTQKYIKISPEMQNQSMSIYGTWSDARLNYYIYDEDGNVLSSFTSDSSRWSTTTTTTINIPDKAYKIGLYWMHSHYGSVVIKEIMPKNSPEIVTEYNYPKLTKDGIVEHYVISTVNYFKTSKIKLYKINDQEWKEYTEPIKCKIGENLYVKGIDDYGIETINADSTYINIAMNTDSFDEKISDNDETTGVKLSTKRKYILISPEMQNQKMSIYGTWSNARLNYYIYDKDENILSSFTSDSSRWSRTTTTTIDIPDKAYKIGLYWMHSTYGSVVIKEVKAIYNEE